MVNTVDNLLSPTAHDSWRDLSDSERANAASQLLKSMDNTGFLMAEYLYGSKSMREERNNVGEERGRVVEDVEYHVGCSTRVNYYYYFFFFYNL